MTVIHCVQFGFKADVEEQRVHELCGRLLDLKQQCINPTTQKPYIQSLKGGVDNSPEGLANGFQYAFVMEFANAADRVHYVHKDPAHLAFIEDVRPVVEKAQVMDFEPGVFR